MTRKIDSHRKRFLKTSGILAAAAAPIIITSRKSWAEATELNMLAWYGHGEPDIVEEFEAMHDVKFKPRHRSFTDSWGAA